MDINAEQKIRASLARRYRRERWFYRGGLTCIALLLFFLLMLFNSVLSRGYNALWRLEARIDIQVSDLVAGEHRGRIDPHDQLNLALERLFPNLDRGQKRELRSLFSHGASRNIHSFWLDRVKGRPQSAEAVPLWLPLDDKVALAWRERHLEEGQQPKARLSAGQWQWLQNMAGLNRVEERFNSSFFTNGASREPELAGIAGALTGSMWMMIVTLILAFPLSVSAALYLEEFAPRNRWTSLIEININNLAAVPSIIFGLFGLAIVIEVFGFTRSTALTGGIVLALMTMPTIIISARAAIQAVPQSLRDASLALGASHSQTAFRQVLPASMSGILTGTILGISQALGETAPLLMIGMAAFIVDVPLSPQHPSTALPVQIYLWADSPELGFVEKTSAAILLLLLFMLVFNLAAIILRNRLDRR